MSNATDFVIENGVLKKYKGPGGDVVIPEGVTSIGEEAFYCCSNLTSVVMPEGVTEIRGSAFYKCSSLTSVVIPEGVTFIGYLAFDGCESLTSVVIPEGVTTIGYSTFSGCEKLTSVVIPESVTSIGGSAFRGCSSLTSVVLPEKTRSIGNYAFSGCSSLISINISEGVTSIGEEVFYDCSSLTSVVIPEGVTTIGKSAFERCSNLTSVVIPEGVTFIGNCAFEDCSSLTSVVIPESVTKIGYSAFSGCSSNLGIHVSSIERYMRLTLIDTHQLFLNDILITDITALDSITAIGDHAFHGCSSLTSVVIPEGVTAIGKSAFEGCHSLASVVIPEGVTSIGYHAFCWCGSLTSVVIPDGVTDIEEDAFSDCTNLKEVVLPEHPLKTKLPLVFGDTFPNTLLHQLDDLAPKMTASAVKKYVLTVDGWAALSVKTQATVFLDNQSKSLNVLYNSRIKQPEPLGEELLLRLDEALDQKKLSAVATFMVLFSSTISAELLKALYEKLKSQKSAKKALKLVEEDSMIQEKLKGGVTQTSQIPPIEAKLNALLESRPYMVAKGNLFTALRTMYSLPQPEVNKLPELRCKDGSTADPVVLTALLTAHEASEAGNVIAAYTTPGICPEAAALLEELDQDRFREILDALVQYIGSSDSKKRFLLYPICRYADEDLMHTLPKGLRTGKTSVRDTLNSALSYSQTKESMWLAEKYNGLGQYAAVRGMTSDAFRYKFLYDVGLDSTGCKRYDLGNQSVLVRLKEDFSYQIELENGKPGKSLPKKGADPEKYAAAQADFSEMKKTTKNVVQNQVHYLRRDFLSGTARTAESWKEIYLCNPLLQYMARLVVWAQNGTTFTLSQNGPIDSAGQPYMIGGSDIIVAHPMEMAATEVTAWQRYFSSRSLKQPFEQVWEPVIDLSGIRPDMYRGIKIPYWSLAGKKMHGIDINYDSVAYYLFFDFADCKVDLDYDDPGSKDCKFEIKSIEIQRRSRASNHVIAYLDRITVYGRIKNDDVSVMNLMDHFTLAQITDFLRVAGEAQAVNVTAALLDYKNTHFADFDPMDEFTLE